MQDERLLAGEFEEHRPRLRAVAYRMLGSLAEADDAVQEAWLRLARVGRDDVDNLGGWLTTVVARRVPQHAARPRDPARGAAGRAACPTRSWSPATSADPAEQAVLADSVGLALLVVLETLDPAERLAFVLHDMFAVPFDEIAAILGRTPAAARQLASRARRRVQGASPAGRPDRARQREIVDALLAAARGGDFEALGRAAATRTSCCAWTPAAPTRCSRAVRLQVARQASMYRAAGLRSRFAVVNGGPGSCPRSTADRRRCWRSRSRTG